MAYENGKTYYLIPTCATGDAEYNQMLENKQPRYSDHLSPYEKFYNKNACKTICEESDRGKNSNTDFPSHLHFEATPSNQVGYVSSIKTPNKPMKSIFPYG